LEVQVAIYPGSLLSYAIAVQVFERGVHDDVWTQYGRFRQ
jgi:hypothetical protein